MENFIDFHQTRDFSRKMNATFEFVKQNFKSLGKSILFISGPSVLVASLLLGSFIGDVFILSGMGVDDDPERIQQYFMSASFWLQILLVFVFMLTSTVSTIATINNYILLYEEKRTHKIDVREVWERVRSTFWMYLGTTILFALMGVVVYILFVIPVVLLGTVSPLLIVFGVIFAICAIVYLMISVSLVFIVRAYERVGFFDALARSFRLVQGKWWSTFGLLFILYITAVMISYIFLIPAYAMMFISAFHSVEAGAAPEPGGILQIVMVVFFTLYYFLQLTLYALPNVGVAFQYFNLVEMKEARGLMKQIDSLGDNSPTSVGPQEHY